MAKQRIEGMPVIMPVTLFIQNGIHLLEPNKIAIRIDFDIKIIGESREHCQNFGHQCGQNFGDQWPKF